MVALTLRQREAAQIAALGRGQKLPARRRSRTAPGTIYRVTPTSVNQVMADRLVAHQALLDQYSTAVVDRIYGLLDRGFDDAVGQLRRRLERIRARGADLGPVTTRRLGEALRGFAEGTGRSLEEAYTLLGEELVNLGAQELEANVQIVRRAVPEQVLAHVDMVLPARETLRTLVYRRPLEGRFLGQWWRELDTALQKRLEQTLRQGLLQGETVDQLVRRVRGTRARGFRDGVLQRTRREVEAIVRTSANHVLTEARHRLFAANADLVKGWQWHATLDPRTCLVCMGRDGRRYDLGAERRPPAHFNCRCTLVPILKSWRELGIDRDELTPAARASMDGAVPGTTTFPEWLRTQEERGRTRLVDRLLGPRRAALWRQGRVSVEQFSTTSGRIRTLQQLRDLEARHAA